jgi:PAS domain S-box-containing protein
MIDRTDDTNAPGEATLLLTGLLAIAADAIIAIDEQQRITLFNHGAEVVFGYASVEVLGQPLEFLLPERFRHNHSDHVRAFGAASVPARRMGERQEIYARRKDGHEFAAEASICKLEVGGRRSFMVVLRDISERKRVQDELTRSNVVLEQRVAERTAELTEEIKRREETHAQLIRTQRMEAFGQLTGGIAHDFNNLLTVISGNLELLEMRLDDEKDRTFLKRAQDASEMGARLTGRLLTFARRRQYENTSVDLNDYITSMIELLNRTLGDHIELKTRLSPQLWAIRADPSEIENAVLNLAINARDAMLQGGKLSIETANVVVEDGQIEGASKLAAGDYVRLCVSDTGSGMPPDVVQRAFEPFFTTKSPGKGTGLGLSTIYGFVQSLGGTATIYSEPGLGTTVNLYMPRMGSDAAKSSGDRPEVVPVSAGETVLLIEDNPDVREVARQRLEFLGYRVVEAENGPAALDRLRSGADIDIVFSDVVMPDGLSGFDVARAVRATWPSVKVLLTSGYAEDALREQSAEATHETILHKPYGYKELARAIRRMLDA